MLPMVANGYSGPDERRTRALATCALAACALAAPGAAQAAPCSDLPNPVYVSSGSVSEPVLHQMAPLLAAAAAPDNMTVVYVFTQTCDTLTRLAANGALAGTARYYPSATTSASCDVPAGTRADVGVGNLFAESCVALAPTLDVTGIRQGATMVSPVVAVVPVASTQTALAAEEAYFVWGFGMAGRVAPWLDDARIFRRTPTAGTQTVLGASIRVPATRFRGTDGVSVQALLNSVATSSAPDATIGFVSAAEADAQRASVRVLAFRAYGQRRFYWPDSARGAFDRRNVRDGHYQLWGYEHAYLPPGAPPGGRGERFYEYITGARPLPGGDIVDVAIAQGFVPVCAMDVERTADDDGSSVRAATPAESCACYFDARAPMGHSLCARCAPGGTCAAGRVCRRGYCEAR